MAAVTKNAWSPRSGNGRWIAEISATRVNDKMYSPILLEVGDAAMVIGRS